MSASPAYSQAALEAKRNGKPYHKLINRSQFKNLLIAGKVTDRVNPSNDQVTNQQLEFI